MLWSTFFKIQLCFESKTPFFRKLFRRKYLKNHNMGPRSGYPNSQWLIGVDSLAAVLPLLGRSAGHSVVVVRGLRWMIDMFTWETMSCRATNSYRAISLCCVTRVWACGEWKACLHEKQYPVSRQIPVVQQVSVVQQGSEAELNERHVCTRNNRATSIRDRGELTTTVSNPERKPRLVKTGHMP
jgi:hypothetical protein